MRVILEALGDRAILLRVGEQIDDAVQSRVRALCAHLEQQLPAGVIELVPAFTTVAVHYDPRQVRFAELAAVLHERANSVDEEVTPPSRTLLIPVRYGGVAGPDLEHVATNAGLTPDEVVRLHAAGEYVVHMIGFAPGFPYLGGLDARIACARRDTPRTRVHAGSVGIGGSQTGVYPIESPGGWQIIGRTELKLFDPARDPAALLKPGDRVRFTVSEA